MVDDEALVALLALATGLLGLAAAALALARAALGSLTPGRARAASGHVAALQRQSSAKGTPGAGQLGSLDEII
jgi:hypothetical protein